MPRPDDQRQRVVYISPYFWPESIGSSPYATAVAERLALRHDVSVLAFRPHYPSISQFPEWAEGRRDEEALGPIRIRRVATHGRGSGGFKDRLRNDLRFFAAVVRQCLFGSYRNADVYVVYVPSSLSLLGVALTRLTRRSRIVAIVHDIESGLAAAVGLAKSRLVVGVLRTVERLAFNRADVLVVLTAGMEEELRKLGCRRPIRVLPIWADVPPAQELPDLSAPTLMYSGNFGKKQGLDQLLPLIKLLDERKPAVRVVLRGDGSERPRLEEGVRALGVSNTSFQPLVPRAELTQSLQSAHVHLVPQALDVANYALPSKIFTVMAAGRPFLCIAETGSPLDQIASQSGAGYCVPPGDAEALYRAVDEMLSNPAHLAEMGERGRAFVAQHMNEDTILRAYERLISSPTPDATS